MKHGIFILYLFYIESTGGIKTNTPGDNSESSSYDRDDESRDSADSVDGMNKGYKPHLSARGLRKVYCVSQLCIIFFSWG